MSYANVSDLTNRLGNKAVVELTNPNSKATEVNNVVADEALADGQALVDSYIGQRVTLPLDINAVPRFVKTLTVDLAIYYLQVKAGNTNSKDSVAQKLYDDAIKHLERFAKGETSLGLAISQSENEESKSAVKNTAEITSEPRHFTRGKLGKLT